ncbi:MAG: nucleotidyltransferase family protein [bacterium]|jgi:predicted nucleotidyltransferase|nr:nucleotidyltransferase family protein [bacterium]MBK9776702.1 nucleotidyltransferase family protein [bacterium]
MTTFEALHTQRARVLEIAQSHGVTSIRVFGSVARGEETDESDIDFLVTTGPTVSSWFPARLILDLEELLGRHIDIVTEAGLNPHIRDQVLAEAVAL